MESVVSSSVNPTQIAVAQKMFALRNQIKGGIGWFYWIAGLSVINSVIFFAGGSLTFMVGLGSTQFIDGFSSALAREFGSQTGTIIRFLGFGLDMLVAGIFALCGFLGQRRWRWVVAIGMMLYAFDGLIFVAFSEWFGALFHAFALFNLWQGVKAINNLTALEKSQSVGEMPVLEQLLASQQALAQTPARPAYQRSFRLFAVIAIALIVVLFLFVAMLLPYL